MTHKTYTTRQFIAKFNFPDPDWDRLPPNFPNLPKEGLSREEDHLLDAIKLAYFVEGGWRIGARKSARIGLISLVCLISLIRLVSHNQAGFVEPVQAATMKVNEAIESTMSAILRR